MTPNLQCLGNLPHGVVCSDIVKIGPSSIRFCPRSPFNFPLLGLTIAGSLLPPFCSCPTIAAPLTTASALGAPIEPIAVEPIAVEPIAVEPNNTEPIHSTPIEENTQANPTQINTLTDDTSLDDTLPDDTLPDDIPPDDIPIAISQIDILDSTVFSSADFAPIVAPYIGKSATIADLQSVADAVTQLYLDAGYITSRAVLVEQVIQQGVVQIRVIEGSLEAIEITGNRRVRSAYIRRRVALGTGAPLHQGKLEDQLRLLRLDPLFANVEASLRAGSGLGQSILLVRVTEADPIAGSFSFDNQSTPSVGSERLGGTLTHRNLTGNADTLQASYYRSTTGGSHAFDFSYQIPLNPLQGTLLLRYAPNRYRVTDPEFDQLDIRGHANLYEINLRQPLHRSPRQELAVSLGLTHRDGESLISDFDFLTDRSTTSVIALGQDYTHRDPQGAWVMRSQFNLGTAFLDATSGAEPNGQFFSWVAQAQRVQQLGTDHLLVAALEWQLTPDALLPSQQFLLGGRSTVRGYRQNARSGDNGWRFSIEDRITLHRDAAGIAVLQIAPFIDLGAIWNAPENPTDTPDQSFLGAIGLGLSWQLLPQLNLEINYGLPWIDLPERGENAQDGGLFFQAIYQF